MLANKRDPVLPVGHGLGGVSEGRDLERFWCEVFKWFCYIYPAGDQHILFRLSNRLAGCHSHWIYFFFFVVSQVGVIYVGRFFICGFKKQGTCECLNGINGVNRMQIIFSQGQGPKSCVSQDNQLELSQWRLTYPRPVGGALLHHGTSTWSTTVSGHTHVWCWSHDVMGEYWLKTPSTCFTGEVRSFYPLFMAMNDMVMVSF